MMGLIFVLLEVEIAKSAGNIYTPIHAPVIYVSACFSYAFFLWRVQRFVVFRQLDGLPISAQDRTWITDISYVYFVWGKKQNIRGGTDNLADGHFAAGLLWIYLFANSH